jgi:1-phosphofructokinase
MIYTVTLNPSLDKTLAVPSLQPGTLHRARIVRVDPGGKGINVSRALAALGGHSRIISFFGGKSGEMITDLLHSAGLEVDRLDIEGETRQNITLLDEKTGQYTKINEPGPSVKAEHVDALFRLLKEKILPGDRVVFSGSLPENAPQDLYQSLIECVNQLGGQTFLDGSGKPLQYGVQARPYAIRLNAEETSELLNRPMIGEDDFILASCQLQTMGIELVVISLAADGIVLAQGGQVILAKPPAVIIRSSVGAGDASLAGLLWAVSRGCDPAQTASCTAACGTATAMQEGTGVGDRLLVEQIQQEVEIIKIS